MKKATQMFLAGLGMIALSFVLALLSDGDSPLQVWCGIGSVITGISGACLFGGFAVSQWGGNDY